MLGRNLELGGGWQAGRREHGRQTNFRKENNGSSWYDLSDDRISNVVATNSVKIYPHIHV